LWSLEIDTGKSPLILHRGIEKLFSFVVKFSNLIVIQEKTRLNALSTKLGVSFHRQQICLIPHSPIGKKTTKNNSEFFQKKFNFSTEDVVILHAGWIHDAMCVDQLAACCVNWKHSYKLVLHEREFRSENEPFIQHVIQLSEGKAHLSLQPVCFDRIDEVFSSARIGIIAYDKRYGGGRENAHKASGKLGHYLKCGVPVIALDLPGYRDMFAKYKCGMVFQDFDEVEKCIDIIINNYDSYSSEALRCFQDEFEFSKYFNPFYQFLKKSTRQVYI
jgi:glycosyltransferase involved in cell wall biosynthesis